MFQSRSFPSRLPEMKNRSSGKGIEEKQSQKLRESPNTRDHEYSPRGWKQAEVTKSRCPNVQRHSFLERCQSFAVLSILEDRRKLFCRKGETKHVSDAFIDSLFDPSNPISHMIYRAPKELTPLTLLQLKSKTSDK